jgi:hypothetical protein
METTYDFLSEIDEMAERFVSTLTPTNAQALGLDPRSGYNLYVSEDTIVVGKHYDNKLQYYGGFEYIDKSSRREVGDYVFYTIGEYGDDRVEECLNLFYNKPEVLDEDIVE